MIWNSSKNNLPVSLSFSILPTLLPSTKEISYIDTEVRLRGNTPHYNNIGHGTGILTCQTRLRREPCRHEECQTARRPSCFALVPGFFL